MGNDGADSKKLLFLVGILIVLLVISIMFFVSSYQHVSTMIDQERQTYIYEVSGKIATQISATLNHLNKEAAMLPAILDTSDAKTFEDTQKLFGSTLTRGAVLLLSDEGKIFALSGQQTSMGDRDNLVKVVFDRTNTFAYETDAARTDYWVFSYPCETHMIDGNKIVGVMMAYPASDFSEEFSMQLFGQQGYALLCDNTGSIRLRPKEADWIGYNLFTSLAAQGLSDDDVARIQAAFTSGGESDLSITLNDSLWLVHCESLKDETLGSLSNLVVMVPIEVITNQVSQAMRTAIYSSLFVAIISASIIVALLLIARRSIEDRKKQEQNAKIEIALRSAEAKSDFLARMSHDIRTPLNAIIGLNYIASQHEDDPEVTADCNRKLGASADYLLQILNDVLDMSKIESGKLEMAHTEFSPEDLLDNLSTMIVPRAQEKNIDFSIEAPTDFGENYIGDRLRISQILMNLLTNAIKFTPDGGKITLSCHTEPAETGKRIVIFSVSDTGIGMSDEYMERLFTPFEQENPFSADRNGGSGLGLSIVHSLVTMMDGAVTAASKRGEGSTFTVRLPLETSKRVGRKYTQEPELDSKALEGKRVLLAEDNEINQEIAVTVLESMGLVVDTADNGRIALERFLSAPPHTYDVILSDIRMPEMGGYEFAAAVRASKSPEASSIPIAALSANAFQEDVEESLRNGMNAHLRKPIEVDEIRMVLTRLLLERNDREGHEDEK